MNPARGESPVHAKLTYGRIVWAERPDPNGRNSKRRPWVVLTATADIRDGGVVRAVAVSTRSDSLDTTTPVILPWGPGQERGTKLTTWSAAVCPWLAELVVDEFTHDEQFGGTVPAKTLWAIQQLIREIASSERDSKDSDDQKLNTSDAK